MRIKNVHIKNYRSFKDVEVSFENYTALVGPNGAGKSTVLCALNIFFREAEGSSTSVVDLDEEDFHGGNIADPIEITVTFHQLNEEAQKEFAAYYRNGLLVVSSVAKRDPETGLAMVRQFGQRHAMKVFSEFFKLYESGASAGDVKVEYEKLIGIYPDLPKAGAKEANRTALRAYEEAHPGECEFLPSEDQFYGFSKGANKLSRFVQWVYVPAVKDATKENIEAKNTALGKLLARTVRSKVKFEDELKALRDDTLERYRKILSAQQGALDEVSKSLSTRLAEWAHPNATARLAWTEDSKNSVRVEDPAARLFAGEGTFEGDIARFGHGLQRSYLLALLQELASGDDAGAPRLILACEEPELYQHPPQARYLSDVFVKLAEGNAQILVTTHSPYFVSGRGFESVRLVRRISGQKYSEIGWAAFSDISETYTKVTGEKMPDNAQVARLHQALQPHLSEMFFAPRIVLVEGLEDMAYITSWLHLSGMWDDYRRSGCHLVPASGKSWQIEPLIVAQKLGIPCFAIFDSDGDKTNAKERARHEIDNKAILSLVGGDVSVPFPTDTAWGKAFVQWPTNLGDTFRSEIGEAVWDAAYHHATDGLGNPLGSFKKYAMHIGAHLEKLSADGVKIASLDSVCARLIGFGAS